MRAYLTLLLTLAAIWGASYLFIEIALRDLEPTTMMALRLVIAVRVPRALMAVRGDPRAGSARRLACLRARRDQQRRALHADRVGPEHIDSGVAAIANATVPLFVAILAIWLAHSERATGLRIVGIALGLSGVGVLTGAQPAVDAWAIVGTLAVVAGRRFPMHSPACCSSARRRGSTRSRSRRRR